MVLPAVPGLGDQTFDHWPGSSRPAVHCASSDACGPGQAGHSTSVVIISSDRPPVLVVVIVVLLVLLRLIGAAWVAKVERQKREKQNDCLKKGAYIIVENFCFLCLSVAAAAAAAPL